MQFGLSNDPGEPGGVSHPVNAAKRFPTRRDFVVGRVGIRHITGKRLVAERELVPSLV